MRRQTEMAHTKARPAQTPRSPPQEPPKDSTHENPCNSSPWLKVKLLRPINRPVYKTVMQRREQLRVAHCQILVRLHPLLAVSPARLSQPHDRRAALGLKLKPRLGPRCPDRRKFIRSKRRQHQLLLRHKTQNRASAGTSARKMCRPLPTLPQIDNCPGCQPSA